MTAGGDPQNGLMGPWAWVSEDFSGPPGAVVAAIPWAGAFAVCAVDRHTAMTAKGLSFGQMKCCQHFLNWGGSRTN
jgi:hypothetical protein